MQKQAAADKRLEEATRLLKEAKEQKAVVPDKPDQPEAKTVPTNEKLKELRSAYIKATQYGEPDEAEQALEAYEAEVVKISAPVQQATPDLEAIKASLRADQLREKLESSPEDGGFKDILDKPLLSSQFKVLVDTLVAEKKGTFDNFDTYKKAGEIIRQIGASLDADYVPPKIEEVNSFNSKKKRKKTITNLPSANAKVKTSTVDDDADKTASQIIAEMRQVRGQG